MTAPNFTPNEIVGYRIIVDSHNWNVALIKKHGPNSKLAGQEYAQILGHYKNLEHALINIQERTVRDALTEMQGTYGLEEITRVVAVIESAKAAVSNSLKEVLEKLDLSDTKIRQQLIRFGQSVENLENAQPEKE